MKIKVFLIFLIISFGATGGGLLSARRAFGQTEVTVQAGKWFVNGEPVNAGSPAEGLLMNVRMVNAVFEDRGHRGKSHLNGFSPEENVSRFISQIPAYVRQGINAFTVSLQGGYPGYEGAVNTAYHPDGRLRASYMNRVERVIRKAGEHGAAIILTCFYQRQHSHPQALSGENAIRAAIKNVVDWIRKNAFSNIVLEISNEYAHPGYRKWADGEWLSSISGQVELIKLAKAHAPELLVSTSGMGNGTIAEPIAEAADFILIHFNNTKLRDIPLRIMDARVYGKPVVCNEDDKIGEEGAMAARFSVMRDAGWGYMHIKKNQMAPFEFSGPDDDPVVYRVISRLTGSEQ